jgi:NAD(P)-dependent dehydrogenase (short-subunit alcohol dehydrogenase family)
MGQLWSQTFPPKPQFHAEDVPDLSGKVMIVTGGNTGIGKEIVRVLLTHNAKVYLAARNVDKGHAAIEELKKDTGKEATFLQLDLCSLKSIRGAVDEFSQKERELHALFNNGGVMFLTSSPHAMDVTEDGYDIQWATNALGPFYFTKLLIPALTAGAKQSADGKARVTFSASIVQTKSIKYDVMTDTPARKKMCADQRYGQSKFANVVMAREFARRYGDKGLLFNSLDPGGIKTGLQQHMPGLMRTLLNPMLHPVPMGALTPLWAATSPEAVDLNGKFLIPFARVGVASEASQDPKVGEKLFEYFEEEVKKH